MATRGPQQKEVKRIKTCAKDGGNRVLAFEILNLHNRKIKPLGRPPPVMLPKAQFIIHANAILANICPAQWALGTPYRVESRKAVEKVMSALLTIARVHREMLPVWNLNALITIGPGDFAANVVWATLAPPLPVSNNLNPTVSCLRRLSLEQRPSVASVEFLQEIKLIIPSSRRH